jgi:hypothetical protein
MTPNVRDAINFFRKRANRRSGFPKAAATRYKPHLASRDIIRSLVERARSAAGIEDLSPQFVLSESMNVVDAWQVAGRRQSQ